MGAWCKTMARRRRNRKLEIIPQPPVDPARRSTESRPRVIGLAVMVIGLASIASGLAVTRALQMEASAGDAAPSEGILLVREWQLVKAFTRGGIKDLTGPRNGDDFVST